MGLAQVLTAMREIILDAPKLPTNPDERGKLFARRFPDLSTSECQDLTKIPPEKFSLYTTSIFQSEKKILETHMPLTMALLKHHWSEAYNQRFVGRLVPQLLHKVRPWQSQSPLVFVDNFCQFVNHDSPQLLKLRPDLGAIALLEGSSYHLKRAPDIEKPRLEATLALELLSSITVAELLTAKIRVNHPLETLNLPFDVLTIRNQYYQLNQIPPEQLASKRETLLAGTRGRGNKNYWIEVPRQVFDFLSEAEFDVPVLVEEFAGKILGENADDEKTAFEYLIKQLAALVAHEIISLEALTITCKY